MTPEILKAAIERIYGKRGGSAFCREYGINRSTLFRWQDGRCPIPVWVKRLVIQKGYDDHAAYESDQPSIPSWTGAIDAEGEAK